MNFENQFVAHGKINFFDFAVIKSDTSKSHIINFGFVENTIVKSAVDKGNGKKSAGRKITIIKNAAFEVFKIKIIFGVNNRIVFFIKKIFAFFFQLFRSLFEAEKVLICCKIFDENRE